jgi:site-specific DNA recombinase
MLGRPAQDGAGVGSAFAATSVDTSSDPCQPSPGNGAEPGGPAAPHRLSLTLAAAYARVSCERQEREQTLDSQIEGLRRAAIERNLHLAPEMIFTDDGRSGARLDRPGLDRLRDLVSEGACATVLVQSPDRLTRSFAYQVVLLDEFRRAGCEIIFLNHAFDTSPEQQVLLQMQGVFAGYERALIEERTRRGRLFAARQGRVNWSGNPPYGYRYLRKTETTPQQLLINESEAAVVQQMFRWLVDEQISSHAIQRRLTALQVPTRAINHQGWCQSPIIDLLRNPIYKGEGWYNRTQRGDATRPRLQTRMKDLRPGNGRGRISRPRDDWIPVPVPALVDAELWQMAQEQLTRNRDRAKRNNAKHHYLLRSLLICGRCGRRLIGTWSQAGQGRYICSARYPRTTAWACDGRSLSADRVEHHVWDHVRPLLSDPELLRARYEESRGDPAINGADERERERIDRKMKTLEREVQRLVDAYQAGVIELDELRDRRRRLEDHGQMLRGRVGEIDRQRHEREQEIRLLQGLQGFCVSIRDALDDPSFEIKQQVLRLVIDRIVVEDTRAIIQHIIPVAPVALRTRYQARGKAR